MVFTRYLILVTVSGCVPYAAVYVRQPSFPGCRLTSLEQSATSRHVCTVTACFLQSSEDSSLQSQFSLTIFSYLRSDTRCSYLLT